MSKSEPGLFQKFAPTEFYVVEMVAGEYKLLYHLALFSKPEQETITMLFYAAFSILKGVENQ